MVSDEGVEVVGMGVVQEGGVVVGEVGSAAKVEGIFLDLFEGFALEVVEI